jgi:plasmid stabilization system protein ParE
MIPVILAPEAVQNLEELAAYAGKYSAKARLILLAAVAAKLQLLEQQPEMYPIVADRAPFRRCVVTATVSLYYQAQTDAVQVFAILDSRRDPGALTLPPA